MDRQDLETLGLSSRRIANAREAAGSHEHGSCNSNLKNFIGGKLLQDGLLVIFCLAWPLGTFLNPLWPLYLPWEICPLNFIAQNPLSGDFYWEAPAGLKGWGLGHVSGSDFLCRNSSISYQPLLHGSSSHWIPGFQYWRENNGCYCKCSGASKYLNDSLNSSHTSKIFLNLSSLLHLLSCFLSSIGLEV